MKRWPWFLVTLTFVFHSLGLAQEAGQSDAKQSATSDAKLQASQPLPLGASALSLIPAGFGTVALEATEKDSNLVARVGYQVGDFLFFGRLSAELDEGEEEATFSSLDELSAPTLGTIGVTYEFLEPAITAEVIETTCKEFRQEVFAIFAAKRPEFRPVAIERNECEISFLKEHRSDVPFFFDALRARNLKLNALCDDYNARRGSGRLLATRADDQRGTTLIFEEGAEALAGTFDKPCTEENLIQAVREEAARKAEPGQEGAEAEKAEKAVQDELAKTILPFCQDYNNHAYPLLRKLEPDGAVGEGKTPDRGCEQETIRQVLVDPIFKKEFREKWENRLAKEHPFNFWTLSASITEGKNDFKIFDPAGFNPTSQDPVGEASREVSKTSRNFTTGLTYHSKLWSISGGYTRKLDVKPPEETDICIPLPNTGVQRCLSALITDPKEEETDIVTFEAKRFLFGSRLGAQLRVLHDVEESETEPHLSLYFFNQEGKGLTGGVEVFYSNETNNLEGRVFIGAAFSVSPSEN